VSLILGNDLAGGKVEQDPQIVNDTKQAPSANDGLADTFPACVVTRAAVRHAQAQGNSSPTA